jgi:AcrR family transcriptional regulator
VRSAIVDVGDVGALAAPGDAGERIVEAALRCLGRWGLAKTTLDDIAREAGCGRATVYRLFPGGRDALFAAVLQRESGRLFDRIAERAAGQRSLDDLLVVVITEAGRYLSGHAPLQFLLANEPEAILPHLAFHRFEVLLRTVAAVIGPLLAPWLAPTDEESGAEWAARSAEWVTRIVISYLTSPAPDVDVCRDDSVRRLVALFVIPGLSPTHRPISAVTALVT